MSERSHKTMSIKALREHLDYAKSRLSHEKADILSIFPLPDAFSREEYAFAYMRAERMGMHAINKKLSTISWLPMQIDPTTEALGDGRGALTRWLNMAQILQPDSALFGNDFMHALTRAGMGHGFDNPHFNKLSTRVATLFRDLSCLVGIVYYMTWLAEHGVDEVPLSNPSNLTRTAQDIATYLQSPSLYEKMRSSSEEARANENAHDEKTAKKHHKNGAAVRGGKASHLRVVPSAMMPDNHESAPVN